MKSTKRTKDFLVLLTICITFLPGQLVCLDRKGLPDTTTAKPTEIADFTTTAQTVNDQVAEILFNQPGSDGKPDPYPTDSSQLQQITSLAAALKLDATTTDHLKKCYFYLEYVTKLEIAAKYITYFEEKNLGDPVKLLAVPSSSKQDQASLATWAQTQLAAWESFAQKGNLSGNVALVEAIATTKNADWVLMENTVMRALSSISRQQLGQTAFWKSIPIQNPNIITLSSFWQKYLKYQITQLFEQDSGMLGSIVTSEGMMFPFIPTMESSYYEENFTHIRYTAEMNRLHLLLADTLRDRLIAQVSDWQGLDLAAAYQESQKFKATPFCMLLEKSTQDVNGVIQSTIEGKNILDQILTPADRESLTQEPLFYQELLAIGMIKSLQAKLFSSFSTDKLDTTMKAFRAMPNRPIPDLFLYTEDDYVYLEDINMILNYFLTGTLADLPANPTDVDELAKAQSWEWLDEAANAVGAGQIWDETKSVAGDLYNKAKGSVDTMSDDAAMFGSAIIGAIQSAGATAGEDLMKKATAYSAQLDESFKKATANINNAISDFTTTATMWGDTAFENSGVYKNLQTVDKLAGYLGIQSDIADSADKLWKASFDTLVYEFKTTADFYAMILIDGMAVVTYSEEAITIIGSTVMAGAIDILSGNLQNLGAVGDMAKNAFEEGGATVLNTFLSEIMILGGDLLQTLGDAIQAVSYLAQFLATIFIEGLQTVMAVTSGILRSVGEATGSAAFTQAGSDWAEAAQDTANFKGGIVSIMNTAIILGATVATDGAALGALGMNAAMQVPQVAGGIQGDLQNNDTLHLEKDMVTSFSLFVDASKVMTTNQKNLELEEINKRTAASFANSERNLGFLQNYFNESLEQYKTAMSDNIGSTVAAYLEPEAFFKDNSDITYVPLEVGSTYGFKTALYNLNPSQGVALYNKARNSFSQENAISPLLTDEANEQSERKFWFLQKETMSLPAATDTVEIRIKGIYQLETFNPAEAYYAGIYFGGLPITLSKIKANKKVDLDSARFAKMLVFKKTPTDQEPVLALYEHEAQKNQGWTTITGPTFAQGVWYRMKMNLSGKTLQVKVWKEKETEPTSWQTVAVEQPTDQTTIGIISSGISTEYQFITPQATITFINEQQLRGPFEESESATRNEIRNRLDEKITPILKTGNALGLQAVDRASIIKGNFIYTTTATNIKQDVPSLENDYVVIGELSSNGYDLADTNTAGTKRVGIDPTGQKWDTSDGFGIISLINDQLYNDDGKPAHNKDNQLVKQVVWPYFDQSQPQLADPIREKIISARATYQKKLTDPFKLGVFDLQATSTAEVNAHIFMYQGPSQTKELQTLKKSDYFTLTQLETAPDGSGSQIKDGIIGLSALQNPDGLLSLVTGYLYKADGTRANTKLYSTDLRDYFDRATLKLITSRSIIDSTKTAYEGLVQQEKDVFKPIVVQSNNTTPVDNQTGGSSYIGTSTLINPATTPSDDSSTANKNDASGPPSDDFE